jgi:hypothetical protein
MRIDKAKAEEISTAAQLTLARRQRIGDYELFIATGESKPPHIRYQRFGIEPEEFPEGCFVTMSWLMKGENQLLIAWPTFFKKNHDPYLSEKGKERARINRAIKDAEEHLEARKRARRRLNLGKPN